MNIILALVIFSIIILFHELGHFLLAKYNDVKVNEFCLGKPTEEILELISPTVDVVCMIIPKLNIKDNGE